MLTLPTHRESKYGSAFLSILILAALPILWFVLRSSNASLDNGRPLAYWIVSELLLAFVLCFPLFIWFQRAFGRRGALSIGEWFGIAPSVYLLLAWGSSYVFPEGGLFPLLFFMAFLCLLAVVFFGSVALLIAGLFGMRRAAGFADYLGIGLVMAFGIWAFAELRFYPPAW
jgi:MFS family permease